MAERFDDFDIKLRIPGDEFPESLSAQFYVVALVLIFPRLLPIAAAVNALGR